MVKAWIPESVEDIDRHIHGARIKRAELKAFGISNPALEQMNSYIDRLLDARTLLMELSSVIPPQPG